MIYALIGIAAALCAFIQWGDEIPLPQQNKDVNKKEAKYILNVKKQDEKEKYERAKLNRNPSGFMTLEEYELLSAPKDKMTMEIEAPKFETPDYMLYVPKPSYKIVRYNSPPGSPELQITKALYQRMQQNAQGIVSPDFTNLVYPAIYYYPNSGSTGCDLFVIKLDEAKTNLDKVLTANTIKRFSEPILSTDKDNENYATFRTLTPVDFSADGKKLLVKEKIGNKLDGIWKTNAYVYDFENSVSYDLVEVRDAIEYYWKENKNLLLRDKRWDIYPLGFSVAEPENVVVKAIAYTGDKPVNLGIWSISSKGEQPKLLTFNQDEVQVSMNGYKLIKDGAVASSITEREEKQVKRIEKADKKQKKKEEKAELKELEKSYKAKIKELNTEYKEQQKDYNLRQRINGSTSENDAVEKYKEIKDKMETKRLEQLEKQKEKELKQLEKQKAKDEKNNQTDRTEE